MIEVALVTMAETCVLVAGDAIPCRPLEVDDDSRDLVVRLFQDCLGFDPTTWVSIRQVGFVEDFGRRLVLYTAQIPERSPAMPGHRWASLDELRDRRITPEAAALLLRSINYRG